LAVDRDRGNRAFDIDQNGFHGHFECTPRFSRQGAAHSGGDTFCVRPVPILERPGERRRHEWSGDPHDRRVELVEPISGMRVISAPMPKASTASCTMTRRWVFASEASTAASSQGCSERRSITSTSTPSAASCAAAATHASRMPP
jgi:hypothetical protein